MFAKLEIAALDDNRQANLTAMGGALAVTLLASLGLLYYWLYTNPALTLEASVPGTDGTPANRNAGEAPADLAGAFLAFGGERSELPGAWAQFRGANSDNISTFTPPLMGAWDVDGPEVLWTVEVGEGFAAPAVLDGCVYLMDYDEELRADALRCFSLADGEELWRRSYEVTIKRNHGMSRTIPALTKDYVLTMGPRCHVVCLDTATGDFRWGIDLKRDYGTAEPLWYTGQCPIIDDGLAILAPCGDEVLMMGVDCATGSVMWRTPNPRGWEMSHSSIIPMTLLGTRMYVYCALGGIVGVSAEPNGGGEILWELPWNAKVVAPSPVQTGDDQVFMTAGYGKGSMMIQLTEDGGVFSAEVLYEHAPDGGLACEQQTPIYRDGLLYGIMPKDAGALKGQFVCYRTDGTLAWASGNDNRFGFGPFLLADEKFFLLDDDGVMTVLDATQPGYAQLARAEVLEGHDAWGPIALAGTRMLVRDMHTMACIEMGAVQ
jgi:putative pyrroloquinoline-quinone binding quinoprotein